MAGDGFDTEILGLVDTEQHDHEEEQDHDRTGVHDDLHRRQEVRFLHDKDHGDTEQGLDQEER